MNFNKCLTVLSLLLTAFLFQNCSGEFETNSDIITNDLPSIDSIDPVLDDQTQIDDLIVDEPMLPPVVDEPMLPPVVDEPMLPPVVDEPMLPPVVDEPSDPSSCASVKIKNKDFIMTKITEFRNRSIFCPVRVGVNPQGLYPEDFGAKADGVTDDSKAIQLAIDSSRKSKKLVVFASNKNYLVSKIIYIRPGTKGIVTTQLGKANIITSKSFVGTRVFILQSASQSANVSDVVIQNLKFDTTKTVAEISHPIFSQNVKKLGIYDNIIENNTPNGGGIYIAGYNGLGDIEDICIEGNKINAGDGAKSSSEGIQIRSYQTAARFDVTEYWSDHHKAYPFNFKGKRVRIKGNEVSGGRYGIALLNVDDAIIVDNKISKNMRNMRFGHNSNNILIDNNICENAKSTSILFGYVSTNNIITRNKCNTSRATSWAMFEATLGFSDSIVAFNEFVSPTQKPSHHYGVYLALHSNNNLIFDNKISGYFSKASLVLEASHAANSHPAHRTGKDYVWQSESSSDNKIISNTIEPLDLSLPVIFMSAVTESLLDTDIMCNKLTGNPVKVIERLEKVKGNTLTGNQSRPFEN